MKHRIKAFTKQNIVLIILLLIISTVAFIYGSKKTEYHVDEMYSYGLANSNYRPFLDMGESTKYDMEDFMMEYGAGNNLVDLAKNVIKDIRILWEAKFKFANTELYTAYSKVQQGNLTHVQTTWLSGEYFDDYLVVEEGTGWNLASVYMNQRADVHPPLFYILLHFISSLFPNVFSHWFAFVLNYIALMVTVIVLYIMVKKYIGSKAMALSAVALYGLSSGFFSSLLFFRMYALLALWTIALCTFHLYLKEKDWQLSKKRKWGMIAIIFLGYYTQYYFVVYAALIMFVALGIMLRHGKVKEAWVYFRQYIWAAILGIGLWPFSISHVFFGYQGAGVKASIQNVPTMFRDLKVMFSVLTNSMFAGSKGYLLLMILLGIAIFIVMIVFHKRESKRDYGKYMLLFVPVVLYFIFVSWVSPFTTDRYIMNLYPLIALYMIMIVGYLCRRVPWKKLSFKNAENICMCIIVVVLVLCAGPLKVNPGYWQGLDRKYLEVPEDTVCIYVMPDYNWKEFTKDVLILRQCKKVAILYESDLAFLESYEHEEGDSLLICISHKTNRDAVREQIIEYTGIQDYEEVYNVFDSAYYMRTLYQAK